MTKQRTSKQAPSKDKSPVQASMQVRYQFRENEIVDFTGPMVGQSDSTLNRLIKRIKSL